MFFYYNIMDLVEYNELPEWYKDNQYIITGYRKPNNNIKNCLTSIFNIHNETAKFKNL
jgi:adiponectin receptor